MPSISIAAEGTQERYQLDGAVITLGRGLESDIRLKDIKSSRRHCQILKTSDGFKIVDLESGNGTYVNGTQIKEQRLSSGDKIQIGSTQITFEDPDERKPAPKPTAAQAPPKTGTRPIPRPTQAVAAAKQMTSKSPAVVRPATPDVEPAPEAAAAPAGRRMPTGRRITHRAKPAPDAGGKKGGVVLVIFGLVALAAAATGGWFVMSGSSKEDEKVKQEIQQIDLLLKEGKKADNNGDFATAIKKYEEAKKIAEGRESFKTRLEEVVDCLETAKKASAPKK